ncbi:MAG TPA: hypothetical protein VKA46_22345 [Gemmataceae bacterium]|nr:hypothetical protein [Gemmataceae bacterium]
MIGGTPTGYTVITVPAAAYASLAPGKSLRIELVFDVTVRLGYQVQTFEDVGF